MNKNLEKIVTLVATAGIISSQGIGVDASSLQLEDFNVSVSSSSASNEDVIVDGDWEYSIENDAIILKAYNGNDEELVIPDTINEKGEDLPVIGIDGNAFEFCKATNIKTIKIGKNLKNIGVTPGLVFGSTAGSNKSIFSNLEKIIVSDDNPYYKSNGEGLLLSKDGKKLYAAQGKNSIISVPDTVECIEKHCFFSNTNLQKVILNDKLQKIDLMAFFNCTSLTSIEIPDSVTTISTAAFTNCTNLSKLIIPESVTEIGNDALKDCINLNNIIIPDKFLENEEIGALLHSVTLSDEDGNVIVKAATQDGKAFKYDGEEPTKEGFVFAGWDKDLSSVKEAIVAKAVFKKEDEQKKVTFLDENDEVISIVKIQEGRKVEAPEIPQKSGYEASWDKKFEDAKDNLTVRVKYSLLYKYEDVDDGISLIEYRGKEKNVIIPEEIDGKKVVKLERTFSYSDVISVTMPDTITEMTEYTFQNCHNLTELKLSNSIKTLEEGSLKGCDKITKLTLPSSLETIKSYAIYGFTNLEEIILPNNLNVIEEDAFVGCPKITSINIPSGTQQICNNAFSKLSGLKNFSIEDGDNEIKIGSKILLGCVLESINVPEKYIGNVDFGCNVNYVIFRSYDNKILSKQLVLTGKDAIEPNAPERAGFDFAYWSKDFKNITENLDIIARYTPKDVPVKKYKVIFKDEDGKILDTQEIEEGLSAKEIKAPEKEGYTFKGWDKTFDNVTEDLEVTAIYEKNEDDSKNNGTEEPGQNNDNKEEEPGQNNDNTEEPKEDEDNNGSTITPPSDEDNNGSTITPPSDEDNKDNEDSSDTIKDDNKIPNKDTEEDKNNKPSDSNQGNVKPSDGKGNETGDIMGFGIIGSLFAGLLTMSKTIKRRK